MTAHLVEGTRPLSGINPAQRVICLLSQFRVCTVDQAARYAWRGDLRAAWPELSRLIWQHELLGFVYVRLPREYGGALGRVLYLRERALPVLSSLHEDLAKLARPGRPRGEQLRRAVHDVCCVEVALRALAERDVKSIETESQLRSAGLRGPLPDLRVTSEEPGGQMAESWEEVTTGHPKSDQIAEKPAKVTFNTFSQRQLDVIERETGRRAELITNPWGRESKRASRQAAGPGQGSDGGSELGREGRFVERSDPRRRIARALRLCGGAATVEALAATINQQYDAAYQHVSLLRKRGRLHSTTALPLAGKPGRRVHLISLTLADGLGAGEKARLLCASEVVVAAAAAGLMLRRFDPEEWLLWFESLASASERLLAVWVDDPELSGEALAGKLARLRELTRQAEANSWVAAAGAERVAEIRRRDGFVNVSDMASAAESKRGERGRVGRAERGGVRGAG